MKACRITLAVCVLACLWVAWGCSTVKPMGGAAVGAGAGLLVGGPVGGAVGAAAGAGAGALWQEITSAERERDDVLASLKHEQQENIDLRATLKANAQIDAYNAGTLRKVPHTDPGPEGSPWYSLAWRAVLGFLGVALLWIFRASVWAWTKRAALYLASLLARKNPPSPAPLDPTPMNPHP